MLQKLLAQSCICLGTLLLPAVGLAQESASVWTVDFVRTRPGHYAHYLRNIEQNWGAARAHALREGYIRSYRALATPDTTGGIDVLLLTEYADSAAWRAREANFDRIFKTYFPQGMTRIEGLSSRQMADVRFNKVLQPVTAGMPPPRHPVKPKSKTARR